MKHYISRNVNSESFFDENELFLVEKLKISAQWIYELKALKAKYEHAHENQLKLLMKAHKWNEAHALLIEVLAPDLFMKSAFLF